MKNPSANKIIWQTWRLLEANAGKYFFPVQVARELQITWVEADLGLRMCVEMGRAFRRDDGRYLFKRKANPADAWKAWIESEDGRRASNPDTGPLQRGFLENRLWSAFTAGHSAGRQR